MKTKLLAATALTLFSFNAMAQTADVNGRIKKLEDELSLLKRQLEVEQEKKEAKAEKAADVEYGQEGLKISSPDKRYSLKVRGYVQADTRTFFDNSNTSNVDQFLVRTARPIFEANFDKDFTARLMLDFGNNQSRLLDAYVDYKPYSAFNIRVGKFKAPIGLERWQSEQEIEFVERGMTTNLVPFRDQGIQLYGDIIPQTLEYQLAFTNGITDLGDANGDSDDSKDVTGRLFAHPFRNSSIVNLQGLGLGVAGSYGKRDGSTSSTNVTAGYVAPAQAKFFTYRSGAGDVTFADGTNWRVNPEAYYYNGPLGINAEYVLTDNELKHNASHASLQHDAFNVVASYVLTGEDASFDGVKVRNNFSLTKGQWGAWEVLGRYGELHIDKGAFPTYANIATSARAAYDRTVGVNWYLNNNLKFNFDYSNTRFDGGAAAGADRQDEQVVMTRAQFRF